jgi:hypothetical protein
MNWLQPLPPNVSSHSNLVAPVSEEVENLLGLRDLEWVTTDPIDHVVPAADSRSMSDHIRT